MKRNRRGSLAFRETFWAGRLGIRGKILLYLLLLAGFMLSLVWLSQSAMLYNIYRASTQTQLNRAAETLQENLNHENLQELAEQIGEENDLGILLVNEAGETVLRGGRIRYTPLEDMSRETLADWMRRTEETDRPVTEAVSFQTGEDIASGREKEKEHASLPRSAINQYLMMGRQVSLAEGRGMLLMTARMSPIRATREAMTHQFVLMVIAMLIATGLVGFTMANSISEPIIETNLAARELSRSRYVRPPHSGGYREIAQLNDTLVQAAESLGRVEDLQRELIANISHDLRTPLTMIEGYAEAMRDMPDEVTPENMQIIIDETNRLSTMVNEVLDFSRLRMGNLELKKERLNLRTLTGEICERVSKMSAVEGYHVVLEPGEDCWVQADSGRISQVVYNLLGNALTYTGEDRTVRVTLERRPGRARMRVSDSGEGIAPDEIPYIWDRYYRSRENHRRAVIGSGLGLNICRSILEKHGAAYGVESQLGQGTTFWFELPLAEEQSEA